MVVVMLSLTQLKPEESMRTHPWLFITGEQVKRAREGIETNGDFAREAKRLLQRAESCDLATLSPLETDWWDEVKHKPWAETYPEINYHSGKVPREWAEAARICARASLLFSVPALQAKAREALLGISNYTFEFEHYDVGLNYANWGYKCLEAYDILFDSFAQAERQKLDAFFERMVNAIINNDEYWIEHTPGGPLNNHYAWHKLGMLMYGLFYDDPGKVQQAIYGPKGVWESLRYGFKDNGLWLESSLNYQFAQTYPMGLMANLLDNAKSDVIDLWGCQTDDGMTLRQTHDALIEILFPDGTLPNIGDCYGGRARIGKRSEYEMLYSRYKDPRYAWLISHNGGRAHEALFEGLVEVPPGEAPALESQRWTEHGYAMLRSREGQEYWSGNGWALFCTFAYSSVHNNLDKLSIMLFGGGRHWLIDCEARASSHHAFSSRVQRELNRWVQCHNTVMVDGQQQRSSGERLDLLEFERLPSVKRLTVGDLQGRLYEGVRQMRTLIVRDDYVLDFFQLHSDEEHEYTWLMHLNGTPLECSLKDWEKVDFPEKGAWTWLVQPRASLLNGPYSECFQQQEDRFEMLVLTSEEAEAIQCGFPQNDKKGSPTWPTRMLRVRQTTTCWFCALYQLNHKSDSYPSLSVLPGEMDHWDIKVNFGGNSHDHCMPTL